MGGKEFFGKSARFELLKSDITLEDWVDFGNVSRKVEGMGCGDCVVVGA
jgi:hypothetical protein